MVECFVLHFLLVGQKIQSALSTTLNTFFLVLHVVLHVHVATAQDFKAEGTEEIFSVFMDRTEMGLYI